MAEIDQSKDFYCAVWESLVYECVFVWIFELHDYRTKALTGSFAAIFITNMFKYFMEKRVVADIVEDIGLVM